MYQGPVDAKSFKQTTRISSCGSFMPKIDSGFTMQQIRVHHNHNAQKKIFIRMADESPESAYRLDPEPVSRAILSSDSSNLVMLDAEGQWHWVFYSENELKSIPFPAYNGGFDIIAFSSDSCWLLIRSHSGRVALYGLNPSDTSFPIAEIDLQGKIATTCCFAGEGLTTVVGFNTGDVVISSLQYGGRLIGIHHTAVALFAASEDGSWPMSADDAGSIVIYDKRSEFERMWFYDIHTNPVTAASFSAQGHYLASGDASGKLLLALTRQDSTATWSRTREDGFRKISQSANPIPLMLRSVRSHGPPMGSGSPLFTMA